MATNMKLKKGDKVRVITGKDKGKEGKILVVDKDHNRVIVEGINKVTKHQKASRGNQQGGILNFEASIHASNVMYLHNGKPTRICYKVEKEYVNDRDKNVKHRVAVSTGDQID